MNTAAIDTLSHGTASSTEDKTSPVTIVPTIAEVGIETLVDTTTAKSTIVAKEKKARGPSKADHAYMIVASNFDNVVAGTAIARADVIRKIETDCNMKNAGASTYYNTAVQRYKVQNKLESLPQLPRAVAAVKAVKAVATISPNTTPVISEAA